MMSQIKQNIDVNELYATFTHLKGLASYKTRLNPQFSTKENP